MVDNIKESDDQKKSDNKVVKSSKRNALGIGTSVATVITWASSAFFGIVIPPDVAVAIAGTALMLISEIKDNE